MRLIENWGARWTEKLVNPESRIPKSGAPYAVSKMRFTTGGGWNQDVHDSPLHLLSHARYTEAVTPTTPPILLPRTG